MIAFFLRSLAAENATSLCTAENSIWNASSSQCICLPGYLTSPDPHSLLCWKCEFDCHSLAQCIHPGFCQCNSKYIGDGVVDCQSPVPVLLGVIGRLPFRNGSIDLIFGYESPVGFAPMEMFCQYGVRIEKAVNFSSSDLICRVERISGGKYNFFISFDSFHWSEEHLTVDIERIVDVDEIMEAIPFLTGMAVAIFVGILVHYGKNLVWMEAPIAGEEQIYN
jgi:hypothetical protein